MNDDDLMTAVKESVTGVHMTIPAEQIVRRSRMIRARRRIPAAAAALAVAAAAVFAVTALLPAHQAGGGPTVTPLLRTRLLAAIDAARGEILSSQVRLSGLARTALAAGRQRADADISVVSAARSTGANAHAWVERGREAVQGRRIHLHDARRARRPRFHRPP
jgi:hypothetical protein